MGLRDRLRRGFSEPSRPNPPKGASNYVLLILDSCRFDALVKANLKILKPLGQIEKRYAYATWTAPSHYNLLMGLLPHPSPTNVFASTYYKKDFEHFSTRLGIPNLGCLLYTSPSPRDRTRSRMPSSA